MRILLHGCSINTHKFSDKFIVYYKKLIINMNMNINYN